MKIDFHFFYLCKIGKSKRESIVKKKTDKSYVIYIKKLLHVYGNKEKKKIKMGKS